MSNMLASLKESAAKASTSVKSGLGIPHADSNASDDNSEVSMMEEMSEYCPKLTFQQVSSHVWCVFRCQCV